MRLTILSDNNLSDRRCACEHGLSVWAEVGGKCYLLDTGQGDKFALNARALGVDVSRAEALVISHGHYDHAGGVLTFHDLAPHADIVMTPLSLRPKYSVSSVMTKYNGVPDVQSVRALDVRFAEGVCRFSDNVLLFTLPDDAPANNHLMIESESGLTPDTFADELFILLCEEGRHVLFGGCTHHGLEQLLAYVHDVIGIEHLDAFVGGLHLKGRSSEEIERSIAVARRYDVRRWIVNHCTGNEAIAMWHAAFGGEPRDGYTGAVVEI